MFRDFLKLLNMNFFKREKKMKSKKQQQLNDKKLKLAKCNNHEIDENQENNNNKFKFLEARERSSRSKTFIQAESSKVLRDVGIHTSLFCTKMALRSKYMSTDPH